MNIRTVEGHKAKIEYDAEDYDDEDCFDTDAHECYIQSGQQGRWEFSAGAILKAVSDGAFVQLALYKEGALARVSQKVYNTTGGASDITVTAQFGTIDATEDDQFDVRIYHNSGGDEDLDSAADSSSTWFSGKQVG